MDIDDENKASLGIERRNSHTPSVHQQDVGYEWNDDHETLLKKWKDRADHYGHLHSLAGKQFSKFNSWLGLPTKILLSAIASVEFSQLSGISNSEWTFYFNGLIALAALALETAQDYLGLAPRASKHYTASNIYEKLAMNIEMEMCNPREKRVNVRAFLRKAKTTLQDLKETAPDIPERILESYLKDLEQSEKAKISQYVRNVPGGLPIPTTAEPVGVSQPLSTVVVVPTVYSNPDIQKTPLDPETDLQDEFANAMQQRLQEKKTRIEQLQMQRFNETENV